MAPAAALATVGDRWAERWRGRTTPVTPAHSALRRRAPMLWGSVIPSRTNRKGTAPVDPGSHSVSRVASSTGRARPPPPAGPRSGPPSRSDAWTRTRPAPGVGGKRLDLVQDGSVVHPFGHSSDRSRASVGTEELTDCLAPLNLIAAQSGGIGCIAGPRFRDAGRSVPPWSGCGCRRRGGYRPSHPTDLPPMTPGSRSVPRRCGHLRCSQTGHLRCSQTGHLRCSQTGHLRCSQTGHLRCSRGTPPQRPPPVPPGRPRDPAPERP